MKVIEQLRLWRADGTLNILINIHALSPAILESLEWCDSVAVLCGVLVFDFPPRQTTSRRSKG